MTTHEAVLLGTFRILVLAVRHVSAMRTRFGKRHGWELIKDGRYWWRSEAASVNRKVPSDDAICLWRALVRRDPKMFGVEKGRRR